MGFLPSNIAIIINAVFTYINCFSSYSFLFITSFISNIHDIYTFFNDLSVFDDIYFCNYLCFLKAYIMLSPSLCLIYDLVVGGLHRWFYGVTF